MLGDYLNRFDTKKASVGQGIGPGNPPNKGHRPSYGSQESATIIGHRPSYGSQEIQIYQYASQEIPQSQTKLWQPGNGTISEHRPSYGSQEMPQTQSTDQAMAARKVPQSEHSPSYGSQESATSTDKAMAARNVPQSHSKLWQPGKATISEHRPSYGSQEMPQTQSTDQAMAARKCHKHRAQTKLWQPGKCHNQSTVQAMAARKVPQAQTKLWQPGMYHNHRPSYGSQEHAIITEHRPSMPARKIPQSQVTDQVMAAGKISQ